MALNCRADQNPSPHRPFPQFRQRKNSFSCSSPPSLRHDLEKALPPLPRNVQQKLRQSAFLLSRGRTRFDESSFSSLPTACNSEASTAWNSRAPTANNSRANSVTRSEKEESPYHVLTSRRKYFLVLLVSLAASFSPLSSNIYFPALDLVAADLHTSNTAVGLSVSVYMIAQGIAPSFWGPLADAFGRRQILIYTLLFYLAANIGLAVSTSYPVLMVFRFLQAAGSSSTISIGAAVIADIAPPAERGGFIGTFSGARQLALAIGPVLGGILANTFGYHSIFWFLVVLGVLAVLTITLFLPETLRRIAGNGSVQLTGFRHQPLYEKLWPTKCHSHAPSQYPSCERPVITWRVFLEPMKFLLEKDVACTLFFGGVIYTVWSMVTSSTSVLLSQYYHLNVLQIGLSFLPNGLGCIVGSTMAGRQLDKDFKAAENLYRYRHGLPPSHPLPKQQLPEDFPLEHSRLAQLPIMVPVFVFSILVYGFGLGFSTSLALPLMAQFVVGFTSTAVLNLNNTLTVDLYPGKSASATAVNNLARCILGAVGVSLTNLALSRLGARILFLILACIVVVCSLSTVAEWKYGMEWRAKRTSRIQQADDQKGKGVGA